MTGDRNVRSLHGGVGGVGVPSLQIKEKMEKQLLVQLIMWKKYCVFLWLLSKKKKNGESVTSC